MRVADLEYTIRFAHPEDSAQILFLIQCLAEFEKLSHEVTTSESELKRSLFGPNKTAEVLIAESSSGKALGFALFFHNFSTFLGKKGLYLEDLFVIPEYRSQGIGMALLSRLAKIALERDCGRMEWSVLNWNQKAIDLYLSLGAKPMSEWTLYRLTTEKIKSLAQK